MLLVALSWVTVFAAPVPAEDDSMMPSLPQSDPVAAEVEAFPFRWKLGGFLGALAGLFVPRSGDALLSFTPTGDERIAIEMRITSPGRDGEYFRYAAEVDVASGSTTAVHSESRFRDKTRNRDQSFSDGDVIDFASVFYRLRWHPPREPAELRIWSDGKIYPVTVGPLGTERLRVGDDEIDVRGYSVRPIVVKGEAKFNEAFSVYFALDERSQPVAIDGKRGWIKVRFRPSAGS